MDLLSLIQFASNTTVLPQAIDPLDWSFDRQTEIMQRRIHVTEREDMIGMSEKISL